MDINLGFSTGFVVTALIAQAFYLYILITHLRRTDYSDTDKIVWAIVLCTLHLFGALLYLILAPKRGNVEQKPSAPRSAYTSNNGLDCESCGRIMKLGHRKCEYCGSRA